MTITRCVRLVTMLSLVAPLPLTGQSNDAALAAHIQARLDSLDAVSSFYAVHVPSGREVAIRADRPMNSLSVIKVPIMLLAFRDGDAGRLDLGLRHEMRPEDYRRGSGLLVTFDPGLSPTYRDVVTQMIITSDNAATDIMIHRLTIERVNRMLDQLGYGETRLRDTTGDLFRAFWAMLEPGAVQWSDREVYDRGFPTGEDAAEASFAFEGDSTKWLGRTTAREMGRMLRELHAGTLASESGSRAMIDILNQQFYTEGLPRFVGGRGTIGNKTGGWGPVGYNDVALVDYQGGPVVLSIFVNQNRSTYRRLEDTISQVAKDVLDAWQGSSGR